MLSWFYHQIVIYINKIKLCCKITLTLLIIYKLILLIWIKTFFTTLKVINFDLFLGKVKGLHPNLPVDPCILLLTYTVPLAKKKFFWNQWCLWWFIFRFRSRLDLIRYFFILNSKGDIWILMLRYIWSLYLLRRSFILKPPNLLTYY